MPKRASKVKPLRRLGGQGARVPPVEQYSVFDHEDPTGRFDILLAGIIERVVARTQDAALIGYHRRCKGLIDHCLTEWFGPVAIDRRLKGGKRVRSRA